MKKKMRETKMRPVKAFALVYEDNGRLHADLMGRPSIGHKEELNQDRWRMGAGLKVVPVLITEIPRKKKLAWLAKRNGAL